MGAMTSVLKAGGVPLLLQPTPAGPLLATNGDPRLEPLAWVVNASVTGQFPDLREAIARGAGASRQGLFASRRDPNEDYTDATSAWEALAGAPPGEDSYVVGTTFTDADLVVPRASLLEIIDGLQRLRSGTGPIAAPEEELDELERRAADLDAAEPRTAEDAGSISAQRRFLLMALDQAGVTDPARDVELGDRPGLGSYRDAALERDAYARSPVRAELLGEPGPPAVSLDWFRHPSPRPNPLESPEHWLASGEAALRAANVTGGAGEVFLRRLDGWWALDWRVEDGVTPVLVRGRSVD
jgi:hypothetical protein